MLTSVRHLKQRWNRGETTTNGWLVMPQPFAAEIASRAGFDSLCIDMQHGGVCPARGTFHRNDLLNRRSTTLQKICLERPGTGGRNPFIGEIIHLNERIMPVAIDQFAGPTNQYRVLVTQDPEEEAWPELLRIGSGADGIALLNDVPVWYEIWRQLNGFPADYYTQEQKDKPAGEKK